MSDDPAAGRADAAPARPYDGLGEAKRLLRTIRAGTLATLTPDGMPFASLVSVATLVDGRPILLLSRLSAHTQHLLADARCSVLLAATGRGDPLAHPRLTVGGRAVLLTDEGERQAARDRFLSRQPKAALYADFPDFGFWRLDPASGHLNGGFARAARLLGSDLLTEAPALAASERGAVEHMNADHLDALRLYGEVLAGAGRGDWTASGLDAEGIDLVCGDRVARIGFDAPVTDPAGLRSALKRLADRARTDASAPSAHPAADAEQDR